MGSVRYSPKKSRAKLKRTPMPHCGVGLTKGQAAALGLETGPKRPTRRKVRPRLCGDRHPFPFPRRAA